MFDTISSAANGMAVQSHRIEGVARAVASTGATEPAPQVSAVPVRVGAASVGGTQIESMVTLVEAETAYRANAAVLATASDMLGTLLDAVD